MCLGTRIHSMICFQTKSYPRNNVIEEVLKNVNSFITSTTGQRLEQPPLVEAVVEKSRAAFPLGLGHTSTYVGHGVCLIG